MFYSSTCNKRNFLGLVSYEKEEIFYFDKSSDINYLYLKHNNFRLNFVDVTIRIRGELKDSRDLVIMKVNLANNNSCLGDFKGILSKTEDIYIIISVELEKIEGILVNEFEILCHRN